MENNLNKMILPEYVLDILKNSNRVIFPESREELVELSFGDSKNYHEVKYDVEGKGSVLEATVTRCKNGVVINYPEDYMRRRDPDCTVVADHNPTDKPKFTDRYNEEFDTLRNETFDWLKKQDLVLTAFKAGGNEYGYDALLIAPANAAFFALGIADLQYYISFKDLPDGFCPKAIIFLAPPFRHTRFNGKQIVVHNRLDDVHELYSYNLYPGPSAKKGVYGVLLNIGEREKWTTVHASTVKVITPYDNEIVIMHEGASGGGKSEMLEAVHKGMDGRIVLGKNIVSGEKTYIDLMENSDLLPVTDDMALCHPGMQNNSHKLVVQDAEDGWFIRLDNITGYGSVPQYEKIFLQPEKPLVFFNLQACPGSTCMPWDHTLDSNGKPCPNPRVILPRDMVPNSIEEPVEIDVRSFGVRTPPTTKENPNYGILGLFHVLPPALAWIWRLVAPRGYNNPSIISSKGLTSEGVGSYWPFATGKMVDQANLLLDQVLNSTNTRYLLIPNQHIGAYEVGFMPQWIAREYISRRGSAKFKPEHFIESRCSLLGFSLDSVKIDGHYIRKSFLQPELQKELGTEGYDEGAKMLVDFFKEEIVKFNTPELNPIGKQIIELFLNDASVEDYTQIIPMRY